MDRVTIKAVKGGLIVEAESSMQRPSWVSCKQLASEMRMDRSACRRLLLRSGIKPAMMRLADSGFQSALAVSREAADRLIAVRKEEGYL
jgi:hypothetical protein